MKVNELVVNVNATKTIQRVSSEQRTCFGELQTWTSGV
jgi:hypothetical protein